MKKIPTIFVRDEQKRSLVTPVATPGCEWVFAGEGKPTRKRDGTAVSLKIQDTSKLLWKRYDAKHGKQPPPDFIPAQDPDPKTGHWPGWVFVGVEKPEDKWFFSVPWPEAPGTYEFCGPKVNGNPEKLEAHRFFPHGSEEVIVYMPGIDDSSESHDQRAQSQLAFRSLKIFFESTIGNMEGIVWHHPDGRMAKIKRRDFGLRWPL